MMTASVLLNVTLVLTLVLAATRLARRSRAAVRHVLLAAAFAVLLILPLASVVSPTIAVSVPVSTVALPPPIIDSLPEPVIDPLPADADVTLTPAAPAPAPLPWSAIALAVWIAGIVVFLLPVVVGLRQVRALRRASRTWSQGQPIVDALAGGIRGRVEVRLHDAIAGPMTCGLRRSLILLPRDVETWSATDLDAAIVHELEHVRRRDWTSQCLARVIAAVYWFHPLVWIAWRQLALEAERACDDAVLRRSEATAYADQLVVLAERLSTTTNRPVLAMANRRDLATRVRAVLDTAQQRGRAGARWIMAATVITIALIAAMSSIRIVAAEVDVPQVAASTAPLTYDAPTIAPTPIESLPVAASVGANAIPAQFAPVPSMTLPQSATATSPSQRFDVVSVKPCAPGATSGTRGGGSGGGASLGSFTITCQTVTYLIDLAYVYYSGKPPTDPINAWVRKSVRDWIRGAPSWAESERFTIEARTSGPTERDVMYGPMLRAVLEERFRLKTHVAIEDVAMWGLTVAKGGPKFKPSAPGDCVALDPKTPPTREMFLAHPDRPFCGKRFRFPGPKSSNWTFGGQTLQALAESLSDDLDARVIDQTGLSGEFTMALNYGDDDSGGPTLFSAVKDQLGLELVTTKGPRGTIVVDSVERPTPNESSAVSAHERAGGVRARLASTVAPVRAQLPTSAQQFHVASVKPCAPNAPTGGGSATPGARRGGPSQAQMSPGYVHWDCVTLARLIDQAHADADHPLLNSVIPPRPDSALPKRVRGGPSWVESDTFTIEARVPLDITSAALAGSASRIFTALPSGLSQALRALLEDRFQLQVHRATEQQDMLALTIAKNGLNKQRVTSPVPGDCVTKAAYFEAAAQPGFDPFNPPLICGQIFSSLDRGQVYSTAPFALLAQDLTTMLDRFVLDQTGTRELFNFAFKTDRTDDPADVKRIRAVEALGLKLDSIKGPAEYFVIDRVERPRPNAPTSR